MFYIAVINLPQRFQIVDRSSPVIAGVKLLPMMISSAVGSVVGGGVNRSRNVTPFTLIIGSAFQLLGYGLMSSLGSSSPTPSRQYGFQVFLGLGFGIIMPSVTIIAQLHAPREWSCKSFSSVVRRVVLLTMPTSCYARSIHTDEISWWQHRPRNWCNSIQQQHPVFDSLSEGAYSIGDDLGVEIATGNCTAHARPAGNGIESLRNRFYARDANRNVHSRSVSWREFSHVPKISTAA